MSHNPYDHETDHQFDRIINPYRHPETEWVPTQEDEVWQDYIANSRIGPLEEVAQPERHPGGRTMPRPDPPRTSRDQATLLLGCGGFVLMLALAVAVVIVAWRW